MLKFKKTEILKNFSVSLFVRMLHFFGFGLEIVCLRIEKRIDN
jgi:hypothetical protein